MQKGIIEMNEENKERAAPRAPRIKPLYIDLQEAANAVGLSPTTVQAMIRKGEFPAPRELSTKRVGWLLSEIEEWAKSRPVSSLPPPPNTGKRKAVTHER